MFIYYKEVKLKSDFTIYRVNLVCTNCKGEFTQNDIDVNKIFKPNKYFYDVSKYIVYTLYIRLNEELKCPHCGNIHDEEYDQIPDGMPLYCKKICDEHIEMWKHVAELRKYGKVISKPDPKPKYIPKCPACQSPNLRKIGGLERAGSTAMFGWFSKKRDKTFECKDCGMMF